MSQGGRVAALVLTWIGVGALLVATFVPWQTIHWQVEGPEGSFTLLSAGYPWGYMDSFEGDPGDSDGGSWYNEVDPGAEAIGFDPQGLGWLRASATLHVLGGLAGLVGAILASTMRSKRAGPIVLASAAGAGMLMVAAFLIGHAALAASYQDLGESLGVSSATTHPVNAGLFLGIAGLALLGTGSLLGLLLRPGPSRPSTFAGGTADAGHSHSPFEAPGRKLRCPKCQMVNQVPVGVRPSCTGCGFGA